MLLFKLGRTGRIPWFFAAFAGLVALVFMIAWLRQPRLPTDLAPPDGAYDVTILRDTWGVPHIFGRTDADAAYGLAWAHAEDDFATIQAVMLAARGDLAAHLGKDGAPNDFMVQLLDIEGVVNVGYPRLPEDVRAICEAYADGINHYAALHPDEAIARLYPARGEDLVAGFVHKLPLFFGLDGALREIFDPTPPEGGDARAWLGEASGADLGPVRGSNAMAISPARSAGGETFLVVNSHQPWTGPVAWYEAHLHSDEGLDVTGGVFPGSPVVLHGHNRRLGWAHTVNRPDLVDVYRLDIDPDDPMRYRVDGEWLELKRGIARIEVKILGPLTWTVEREFFRSIFGPTVRRPGVSPSEGTYAVRFAGLGETRQLEQWYRMNRAHNLDQWLDAMAIQGVPMFHTVYADADGHILYLYNASLPLRVEGHDYSGVVAGTTRETLWTEKLPFGALPRVTNPESGFVQNANNTPFQTTGTDADPRRGDLPPGAALAVEDHMTGRAHRALELLSSDSEITFEELLDIKWDHTYHPQAPLMRRLRRLIELLRSDPRASRKIVERLEAFDLEPDLEDRYAALVLLAVGRFWEVKDEPTDSELTASLRSAVDHLQRHFGRLDPTWGEVNRLRRGELDLPVTGAPDVLHAVYAEPQDDGRLAGVAGDSYVLIAAWDRSGAVRSHSVHQFGSSTLDAASQHYADQAPLFVERRLKPVWLDEADIRANLEREYSPGDHD
ncbi:MAG: acylase [Acidobacteriota bacterium]